MAILQFDPPLIACICGSTRFAEQMNDVARDLTLKEYIVVRPEVVTYSRENDPQLIHPQRKKMLDELHLRKIDISDIVIVVCPGGYIGESTSREIAYCEKEYGVGATDYKPIYYTSGRGDFHYNATSVMRV